MLEHTVTPGLEVQGTKCWSMWQLQVWGDVMSYQLRLLRSTALTNLWSLMSTVGSLQGLLGPSGSSAAPIGPAVRDYGNQWWWLEQVVCTHSAVEPSCKNLASSRTGGRLAHSGGTRVSLKGQGHSGLSGSCGGPGYLCALLGLRNFTPGTCTAVKANGRIWAGVMQVPGCIG